MPMIPMRPGMGGIMGAAGAALKPKKNSIKPGGVLGQAVSQAAPGWAGNIKKHPGAMHPEYAKMAPKMGGKKIY